MRTGVVLAVLVFCPGLFAQHGSNPALAIDQASDGARFYKAQCAGCHAPDGSGTGAGPALNGGVFKHGGSDDGLVRTISKGVPGTSMPAFSFDASQMWQLVAHIRALTNVRAATTTKGNGKAGAALFRANCAGCHTPSGRFTGPELSGVAVRRTEAEMREAILEPSVAVAPAYWSVAGRTHAGKAIQGIRMNEDTSSVQLRDGTGRLASILKKDLVEYNIVRTSPMPSFRGKLSETQVDDLVAFLIKGEQ